MAIYVVSGVLFFFGMSYAAVPLYQMFCQATGYGGTTRVATLEKFRNMRPVPGAKPITIQFTSDTADDMPWEFTPQQETIRVVPGEKALAFFTAYNPTNKPITGVSTYNVTPLQTGVHFNKIQCFCFEEQRLRPKEEVDMPIFFYVDPDFVNDPSMEGVNHITLSYTFFRTGEKEVRTSWSKEDDKAPAGVRMHGDPSAGGGEGIEEWTARMAKETGLAAQGAVAAKQAERRQQQQDA